jgi:WD40 repeat protein
MDFIEGETLEAYLGSRAGKAEEVPPSASMQKVSVDVVLDLGIHLCSVLDYLHTQHPPIIFRDLKPANIMRAADGRVFLIDFGIARHFKPGQMTDTGAFGSVGYAAPEQYGRTQTTPRSDIYSLGATLHHLLTGRDPRQTPFRFAPLHLPHRAPLPELEALILQMLEIDERKRPPSMVLVKQALQRFAAARAAAAPPVERRLSRRTVVAGGAGLVVLGGGIIWFARAQTPPAPFASTAPTPRQPTGAPTPPSVSVVPPSKSTALYTYRGHFGDVRAVSWSRDGKRVVSGSEDTTVQVWDPFSGKNRLVLRGMAGAVYAVAWSPDGAQVASGTVFGTIEVWDIATQSNVYTVPGSAATSAGSAPPSASERRPLITPFSGVGSIVHAVAWSPTGNRIASGGDDGAVKVWDADTGANAAVLYRGEQVQVHAIAWAPEGKRIAFAVSDGTIHVADVPTGRILLTQGQADVQAVAWANAVAWSPDGTALVSTSALLTAQEWDARTGMVLVTYAGHAGVVNSLSWSPDGTSIASASDDTTVRIWQALTGKPLFVYQGHAHPVNAVSWSPDSKYLASASADETVQIWQMA